MMINEWLLKPITEIPSQEEFDLLKLNLARELIMSQNKADEDARATNRIGIEQLQNRQGKPLRPVQSIGEERSENEEASG